MEEETQKLKQNKSIKQQTVKVIKVILCGEILARVCRGT